MAGGKKMVRALGFQISVLLVLAALVACSKPADGPSSATSETASSRALESIPPADPAKYPKSRDLTGWQNPHLVVREDGIGLVDLANDEIRILHPDQVPAELGALPPSAWPYGRVVLVTEATAKIPTDQAKAEIRKNRGLLAGTLKELDVEIREVP